MFCQRFSLTCTIAFKVLVSVALAFVCSIASAQQRGYSLLTSIDSAEVWFDQIVNPQYSAIINGPEYRIPFKGLKTHPFYQGPESDRGFVRYDGDLYPHLDLLYDTYSDALVLKHINQSGTFFIRLDKNLVQSFEIHQHHFKKYSYTTPTESSIYFDVLFEDKQFAVLVRRMKVEQIEKRIRDYVQNDLTYILNEGEWIKVIGKSSFAKVINKNQRKELSAFIKKNHIRIRKRKDDDLKKLGEFCYSLKEKTE